MDIRYWLPLLTLSHSKNVFSSQNRKLSNGVDWSFRLTCAKFSPSLCETNFAAFRMPSSDCRKSILFPTSKMGTCFWVDSYKCSRMKLLARSGKTHPHLHSFNPIANSQKCPIDRTIVDKNGAVRSSKVRIAQTPKALNKNKSNWHNLLRKEIYKFVKRPFLAGSVPKFLCFFFWF